MSRESNAYRAFHLYFNNIISEASDASPKLLGSFLIQRTIRGNYVYIQLLFVCNTEAIPVEKEISLWLKICRWIETRKEELFRIEDIQKMILLYPRFVSYAEYQELSQDDKNNLGQLKNYWYPERSHRLSRKFPR
jgi:hypothetical protein